jgi:type I restriction enzyme R subunit
MGGLTEDALIEQPALGLLGQLGWDVASGFDEVLGPAGRLGRNSQAEVVLVHRLRDALRGLNPSVPDDALDKAVDAVLEDRSAMDRVRANQATYRLLRAGFKVEPSELRVLRYRHAAGTA